MTPTELKQKIIEHSQQNNVSLLDATIQVADLLDIDIEDMAVHINGSLKEMMQVQCETDGLIKKTNESTYSFD